jgi:hypothetical protein
MHAILTDRTHQVGKSAHIAQRLTGANCWPAIVSLTIIWFLHQLFGGRTGPPLRLRLRGTVRLWQNCPEFPRTSACLAISPRGATLGHLHLRAGDIDAGCKAFKVAIELSTMQYEIQTYATPAWSKLRSESVRLRNDTVPAYAARDRLLEAIAYR